MNVRRKGSQEGPELSQRWGNLCMSSSSLPHSLTLKQRVALCDFYRKGTSAYTYVLAPHRPPAKDTSHKDKSSQWPGATSAPPTATGVYSLTPSHTHAPPPPPPPPFPLSLPKPS